MEGELRCLEKNKRYPGAKAGAHCKLAPSSKRHRSFADQSELNTIAGISVSSHRLLARAQRHCDTICYTGHIYISLAGPLANTHK